MTELRKEFKKTHPETIGETDKSFDDGNYIEWLEKELTEARSKLKNNGDLGDVVGQSELLICPECENPYPHSHTDGSYSCEDCGHKWAN